MKRLALLLSIFLLSISIFHLNTDHTESPQVVNDRLNAKYEPGENFLLQRSFPDDYFDVNAYVKARRSAANSSSLRGGDGYDADWTVQGPGNIGARSNTFAVNPNNENIIYAGFADGGVFKTTDGGENWFPIFDDQPFLAIGDIVLDPQNPEIVYVGTGDPNISGLPSIGDGLYRSADGGATWTNLGLGEARIISKIEVHPTNPDIIYVSAMGLPFAPNSDRGLYKTVDGGANWNKVLFLSDSTGVIDMLLNPQNPEVLYAAGWDRIRNSSRSLLVGDGARIYKSTDGGANWTKLENGLPTGPLCRIGLAMSGQNPDVVFAMIVHEFEDSYTMQVSYTLEGIYKSSDAGANWTAIPTDEDVNRLSSGALGGFGWYFGKLRVNPNDDDDLFLLGVDLWRTVNGGERWRRAAPRWWQYEVHADKHDLVFAPSGDILLATDGGLYKTTDNADNWEDIENIPTTQFYRVAHNPHVPDFYYGGAQDNGTTGGNAQDINLWARIFGGDGFQPAFDPVNPDKIYAETQNGGIVMSITGGYEWLSGTNGLASSSVERRNWDMPYIISPHSPNILYTGTSKAYMGVSTDSLIWQPISENLTDSVYARGHDISAIDESPVIEGLVYVGTSDGNVHKLEPENGDWTDISAGLPKRYVTAVKGSPHFEDYVYVGVSGYKDFDNIPHIHLSKDRGTTWEDISSNLPELAVNDIYILPNNLDSVIVIATDGGVYATKSGGDSWNRLGGNMPIIPVFDLTYNPDRNEIVAGTFARSIMTFPLDSLGVNSEMSTPTTPIPPLYVKEKVKISPNPASNSIEVKYFNIEPNRSSEIVIIDATGRKVLSRTGIAGRKVVETFDVSNFPAGNYFVKVRIRHQVMAAQFVKL